MTPRRLVPSDADATSLSELVADAAAIPAAAFSASRCVARRVIDLTVPAQRAVVRIPETSLSLLEAAEEHIASLSR